MFLRALPRSPVLRRCLLAAVGGLAVVVSAACVSDHSTGSPNSADTTAAQAPDSTKHRAPVRAGARTDPRRDGGEDRSLAQKLDDARLETRVKQALAGEEALRVFDVSPVAEGTHVVLRGDVNTPDQYETAEQAARRVVGVDSVTNELTMEGHPVTDERLDAAKADSGEAVYHTVRRGESLWRIARQYNTTVQRLRGLNGLPSGRLRPGQRIRVR